MNEIVREIPISKGTVNKIIQDWKSNIMGINIEEIRAFTSEVRKSGITIEECAQGFRMVQLLKKFDIRDDFDDTMNDEYGYEEEDLDVNTDKPNLLIQNASAQRTDKIAEVHHTVNKKNAELEYNHIIYFLENIYKNCKKLGITPNNMTGWIEDLLSYFHELTTESDKDDDYYYSNVSDINNTVEKT
jgi:hypothetical protein